MKTFFYIVRQYTVLMLWFAAANHCVVEQVFAASWPDVATNPNAEETSAKELHLPEHFGSEFPHRHHCDKSPESKAAPHESDSGHEPCPVQLHAEKQNSAVGLKSYFVNPPIFRTLLLLTALAPSQLPVPILQDSSTPFFPQSQAYNLTAFLPTAPPSTN